MTKIIYLCFFLLPLILTTIWTNKGHLLATGEEGIPFANPEYTYRSHQSKWQNISLGLEQSSFLKPRLPFFLLVRYLTNLGLSTLVIQKLFFFSIIFLSLISFFYLSIQLITNSPNKYWISFIASIYYVLNPFVAINIWNRFLYTLIFSLPLLPSTLAIYLKGLKSQKIYWAILLPIPSIIFSTAFGSPAVALLLWISIIIFGTIFLIQDRKHFFWIIFYSVTCLILWTAINIWWIAPQFATSYPQSTLTTSDYNLNSFRSVSKSYALSYVFRLLSSDFLFENKTWGLIYSSWYFQIISWSIPIFILITSIKYYKNSFVFILFSMAAISLFIAKGSSPPAGEIMIWLLEHIRPLQLLRNSFEKIGLMTVVAYSGLLAIGINNFIEWTKKKGKLHIGIIVTFFLIFFTSGIYLWPIWTGQLFGRIDEGIGISIPQYYISARTWLIKNIGNYRVLSLPAAYGDGGIYEFGSETYHGLDPLNQIFGVPVVSQTLAIEYSDATYRNYLKWWTAVPLWKSAGLFSAKFIMINSDIAWKKMGIFSPDKVSQFLRTYDSIDSNVSKMNPCLENQPFPQCTLQYSQQNWQTIHYLKMSAQGNKYQKIEVHLIDSQGHVLRFDGQSDPDYIFTNQTTDFIFPLYQPTEGDPEFSFAKVSRIKFYSDSPINIISLNPIASTPQFQPFLLSPVTFGRLKFYEISPEKRVERIFVANKIVSVENPAMLFKTLTVPDVVPGRDVFVPTSISNSLKEYLNESHLPRIEFVRNSSSSYHIKITKALAPFMLVFHESYDPSWKISPPNTFTSHFMADGYANGYLINKVGDFDIVLTYEK